MQPTLPSRTCYINDLQRAGYARIAATIESHWNSEDLHVYLKDLLVDERGEREGFPSDAYMSLLKLHTLYCFEHEKIDEWADTFFLHTS